jgi:hypothetical protein
MVIKELIMKVDRENGQPLWWKNLIDSHSKEGYETRFLNIFYTFRNENSSTSGRKEFWVFDEFKQAIQNLKSNDKSIVESAKNFIENNIIYFLSLIDGIVQNTVKIDIDAEKRYITISFDAEMSNGNIENVSFNRKLNGY